MRQFHLLAFLMLADLCGMRAAIAEDRRPNILLIVADDMGFSDLGCYGGEIATPNLDTLAKDGLRFTQFYNAGRCWPSRASLLTGYYAQQVRRDTVPGIRSGMRGTRPPWAPLLPELLRPLGYRSYHSGKWHVDGKPMLSGFDHSYNLADHEDYFAPIRHSEDGTDLPRVRPETGYYATTAIADHAIKCLREHAEKFPDRPFLEYLAFNAPHFPLHAPPEDIARYGDRYRAGWDAMRGERWKRMREIGVVGGTLPGIERDIGPPYAFPRLVAQFGPDEVTLSVPWENLSVRQREFQIPKMAIHAAMVDRMDREIGRVLSQLRAMDAMENTLILFLSDNGASAEMWVGMNGHDPKAPPGSGAMFLCLGPGWSSLSNTPFRRHKTWDHEGGICTPLIAHWPKGIASRGELRHTPGHVIDLVPTILEIARGKTPPAASGQAAPPSPGISLVPLFAKDGAVTHQTLWWSHEKNRAFRQGDWKIVASGKDSPWELYDLASDRTEARNLADEIPGKVRELAELWTKETEKYLAQARKDPPPGAIVPNPPTPEKPSTAPLAR